MTRLRVHSMSISLDGYAAGPRQSLDDPLGVGGERLHEWMFGEATTDPVDRELLDRGRDELGATIMGRHMFGPIRGPWGHDEWRGWWGDDPPFHHPVFVLTHHARAPIEMGGGTTFHFVTDGIHAAWERAAGAAGGLDVWLGGGASTVRQYVRADLVDELHLAIVPILLGDGERLFDDPDGTPTGFEVDLHLTTSAVTHVRLQRRR
jgi:dihydrofolate reductase